MNEVDKHINSHTMSSLSSSNDTNVNTTNTNIKITSKECKDQSGTSEII